MATSDKPRRPRVPDLGHYLTGTQAAQRLGLSGERVRQLATRGQGRRLPSLVTPLGRLYHPDDIAAWKDAR